LNGAPREALIDEILELEQVLCRAMGSLEARPWLDVDLTMSQFKTLLAIGPVADVRSAAGIRISDLAHQLGVTPGTVSALVDRLVERGLVERRENPQDRRQHHCQLSDGGRQLLAGLAESSRTRTRALLSLLDEHELEDVRRSVALLVGAAERLATAPSTSSH
jgi:DNA-binding MarR family transcriptional regulator